MEGASFWEQNKDLIIIFIVTVAAAIPIALYVLRQRALPEAVKKARAERKALKQYDTFISTFILRNYTKKVYYQIRKVAASGEHETRIATVHAVKKGLIAAFIVGITGTLILDNPVSIVISWVGAYIMLTHMLRLEANRLNKKLLLNFAPFVGLLREEYLRTDSIVESYTSVETPDCLQYACDKIKNILESPNPDFEMNRFVQDTQCSYIRTLAMASVKINDRGDDTDDDAKNESVFVRALKYIEEDAYSELEKLQDLDNRFSNNGLLGYVGGLPTMCLFSMLGTKFVPMVMLNILTMLQAWYGGLVGQAMNVLICVLSVVGFSTASKLMSHAGVQIDDREAWVRKCLRHKWFAQLCHKAAPKKQSKRKLEKILNDSSSCKTVLDISCERLVFAVFAFLVCMIACVTATWYQRDFFAKSTDSFSLMANDDLSTYSYQEILNVDNEFIELLQEKSEGNVEIPAKDLMADEQIAEFVKMHFTKLGDVQVQDQVSRLKKKYDNINGAYFKWWIIVVSYIFAAIGFFYPHWNLKKRLAQVKIEERDDFMQLQTLCTILASADCDVMETLDELSKLTKLYKKKVLTCYLNYATNPEKELARLSSKVKLGNFKHLIKKISLAIDQLSMKEAFEGMDIERKHVLEERNSENKASVLAKREKANNMMKMSFAACLVNELLAPILIVGIQSLTDVLGQMQAAM